jgi:hypothetical protein
MESNWESEIAIISSPASPQKPYAAGIDELPEAASLKNLSGFLSDAG